MVLLIVIVLAIFVHADYIIQREKEKIEMKKYMDSFNYKLKTEFDQKIMREITE